MKKIKKLLFTFAMVFCLAGTALSFTACKPKSNESSISTKNVFAMGMVSASNYLSEKHGVQSATAVSDQTKNTIKQYTKMFEGLLQNGINPSLENTSQEDGENAVFAKKLSISVLGESYTMFYDEVVDGTELEIDDEEIEEETTSFISGKVIRTTSNQSTEEYYVVGSREIESETKKGVTDVEDELILIFTTTKLAVDSSNQIDGIKDSLANCVIIEQEVEDNEIEFEYTTRSNGVENSVELELENEKGKLKLEIEIEEGNTKNKYEIVKMSETKYEVKIKESGTKAILYVEHVDGNWTISDAK